jgi:4'-phosphopantetheinyl transferase EntD
VRGPLAARIADLVPASVSVSEGAIDGFADDLMACERRAIERAVPKRRREFAAGRACAREALAALGIRAFPILPGGRRQPLWLPEIVGSITHTDAYCAAAVARANEVAALGIDVERPVSLGRNLVPAVCGEAELRRCELGAPRSFPCASLLFSIKESIFKAVYPLLGVELGFLDVVVEVDFRAGSFRVRSARGDDGAAAASLAVLEGAFAAGARNLLAAAWIAGPRSAPSSPVDSPAQKLLFSTRSQPDSADSIVNGCSAKREDVLRCRRTGL